MKQLFREHRRELILAALEITALVIICFCLFRAIGGVADRKTADKPVDVNVSEVLSEWDMILVNKWTPIPEGYEVRTAGIERGYKIDERVKDDLEDMLEACRDAGCSPVICSAYRRRVVQEILFE